MTIEMSPAMDGTIYIDNMLSTIDAADITVYLDGKAFPSAVSINTEAGYIVSYPLTKGEMHSTYIRIPEVIRGTVTAKYTSSIDNSETWLTD